MNCFLCHIQNPDNEADDNLFHLLDVQQTTLDELETELPSTIVPATIVVAMSNDEQSAIEAWKRLAVRPNVNAYVLAGGINRWLDLYQAQCPDVPPPDVPRMGSAPVPFSFSEEGISFRADSLSRTECTA